MENARAYGAISRTPQPLAFKMAMSSRSGKARYPPDERGESDRAHSPSVTEPPGPNRG